MEEISAFSAHYNNIAALGNILFGCVGTMFAAQNKYSTITP
ncbi:hypothetical protein [Synechocystis sp. PCC 7509]|nr:hypothetical protein [Synechocystis sp. PCC 7509]